MWLTLRHHIRMSSVEPSMTSPLHGENQAFKSLRAHRLFFQSEALIVADDEHDEDEKLHNSSDTPDTDDDQPEEQTREFTYVVDVGDFSPIY